MVKCEVIDMRVWTLDKILSWIFKFSISKSTCQQHAGEANHDV